METNELNRTELEQNIPFLLSAFAQNTIEEYFSENQKEIYAQLDAESTIDEDIDAKSNGIIYG